MLNLNDLRNDLQSIAVEQNRTGMMNYFKEPIDCYGVKAKQVDEISRHHYKAIKNNPKETIFQFCDELWKSGKMEECLIACDWSLNQKKFYEQKDFECFEFWVKNYITNWATCDTFCTKNMGFFLEKFPEYCQNIKRWSSSKRRWDRRASAVSFIRLSRGIEFLDTIFEITDTLLTDKDDMVQKGYGWLLKETSKHHLELVFNYVMSNKSKMPRTALRYAIEKMPLDLKKEAMLK